MGTKYYIEGAERLETPDRLFPDKKVDSINFAATYRRLFPQYNDPGLVMPYPDVIDTIRCFRQNGMGLAIASSRSHASLREFVERMWLNDVFDALIGGDDVARGKPDPESVMTIINANGWKARDTIVVGDACVDIMMGKAAKTLTCGVTYGNGIRDELIKADADYIIDRFIDLTDVIS